MESCVSHGFSHMARNIYVGQTMNRMYKRSFGIAHSIGARGREANERISEHGPNNELDTNNEVSTLELELMFLLFVLFGSQWQNEHDTPFTHSHIRRTMLLNKVTHSLCSSLPLLWWCIYSERERNANNNAARVNNSYHIVYAVNEQIGYFFQFPT